MDFSSLPHRQVVFRIKITIVLTRVCSLDFLPRESPISPPPYSRVSLFLNFCLNVGALFLSKCEIIKGFFSNAVHAFFHSNSQVFQFFGIRFSGKV
jgi:hypothetical protein